jgi:hypothetical protein
MTSQYITVSGRLLTRYNTTRKSVMGADEALAVHQPKMNFLKNLKE